MRWAWLASGGMRKRAEFDSSEKSKFSANRSTPLASSQVAVSAPSGCYHPAPRRTPIARIRAGRNQNRATLRIPDTAMSITHEAFRTMTTRGLALCAWSAVATFAAAQGSAPTLTIDAVAEQAAKAQI